MTTNNLISISSFPSAILHIDGDAFFTSVEQALKPELQGKPLITGKERGIVACASYEAKKLGVRRPMRLFEARRICPRLICLPSDYETYSLYSKRMFSIIRKFTPVVEEYSIDEAFAEITGLRRIFRTSYAEIAFRIKKQVEKELGLTVSVGLSTSKSLAKLASKENKPNGFTVVKGRDLHEFIKKMPLECVCGFGPNLTALLLKHGVKTVLDYVTRPEGWAKRLLGKVGGELWHELRGEPVYPVSAAIKSDYLSISKTKTFTPPSSEQDFVRSQLLRNLESAFIKLRRHHLRAKKLAVYLRTQDYKGYGLEAEFQRSTRSTLEAVRFAVQLFDRAFQEGLLYRATGVVLSKIEADHHQQYFLFDDAVRIRTLRRLDNAVDGINDLYGKHTVHLGTSVWLGKHRQHFNERGDFPDRKRVLLRGENFRQRLNVPVWQVKV
ncbi:MAG: DNA polymerase IV [Candidatus Omnitrophica bacterium]|nr:DNA polymerase IV [Candidatus Omnitrophota bacterium]